MRKRLHMLLALVLALVMLTPLAACSNGTSGDASTSGGGVSQVGGSTPEEEGEPYEVVMYFVGDPAAMKDIDLINDTINEYLAENKTGIRINATPVEWGQYASTMNLKIQSQEKFDICYAGDWMYNYTQNAINGAWEPLNSYLEMEKFAELKASLPQAFWDGVSIGGNIYGVPNNKEIGMARAVYYRKDLVDALDITVPENGTYQDHKEIVTKLKEANPSMYYVGAFDSWQSLEFESLSADALMSAIRFAEDDYTFFNVLESPEFLELMNINAELWAAGVWPADQIEQGVYNDAYYTDKVFSFQSVYHPAISASFIQRYGHEFVPMMLTPVMADYWSLSGSILTVSSSSENPEKALEFLQLLNLDPFVCNTLNFGIEGKHYSFRDKDKGLIQVPPEGVASAAEAGYENAHHWAIGSLFTQYVTQNEDDAKHEQYREFNDSAIPSSVIGFVFDPTPVEAEVGALTNLYQTFPQVFLGATDNPEATLQAYIAKMMECGFEEVMAEKQSQLDAWLAANG